MPGMSSGLNINDPIVVAAFRSALLHQGIAALLIFAVLVVAWVAIREWRPPGAREVRAARNARATAAMTAEPGWRQVLRIGFGLLWLFDGILQAQPAMAVGLPSQVIEPSATSSPDWVQHLVNWAGTAWSYHPVEAAAATVWIQVGIGLWLLFAARGPLSRAAGVVSFGWGLIVWVFGESFGEVLAPGLSWLTGAPGGVAFYCVAGGLIALPARYWRSSLLARFLAGGTGVFLAGMAVLQAWPGRGFWQGTFRGQPGSLTSMIQDMASTSQPRALASLVTSFGSFVRAHGFAVNLLAVIALAVLGLALLAAALPGTGQAAQRQEAAEPASAGQAATWQAVTRQASTKQAGTGQAVAGQAGSGQPGRAPDSAEERGRSGASRLRLVLLQAATGALVALCLVVWVLVQDFGFFGGLGTDPNSMVPMALLAVAAYMAMADALQPAEPQVPARAQAAARVAGSSAPAAAAAVTRVAVTGSATAAGLAADSTAATVTGSAGAASAPAATTTGPAAAPAVTATGPAAASAPAVTATGPAAAAAYPGAAASSAAGPADQAATVSPAADTDTDADTNRTDNANNTGGTGPASPSGPAQPGRSWRSRIGPAALAHSFGIAGIRTVLSASAVGVIILGVIPMAAAQASPSAAPILAEAIDGSSAPLHSAAPPFALTDQNGRHVSLAGLRGKVILLTFLDPVCVTDCPLEAQEFRQAGMLLGADARKVELVAVNLNPLYSSTAYTNAFDRQERLANVPNWLFLTGSPAQLRPIWKNYGVASEALPAGSMLGHSDAAFVIGPAGQLREELNFDPGPGTAATQSSFATELATAARTALGSS